MDLATLTNERLAVWRNRPTADGGFAFEAQTLPWGPTWSASRVLWGDFDCDGRVDALLVCSDLLRLFSWSPSGWTYRVVANSDFNGLWRLVAAADADGDGDLDLLGSRTSSLTVSLWRNDGRGGFTLGSSPIFRASAGNAYVRDVGWVDVDGDGVPEPWVLQGSFSIYDSEVVVLKRGFASYSEAGRFATGARMGRHLFWADLDGDGRLDVAQLTGGYYDFRAEAGLNQIPLGLQVLKGNGEGDFDEATALVMPALATNLTAVVSATSGRLDLLTGARWLRNRSTAVNTAPTVPTGLRVLTGTRLRFQWQPAADFNQPGGLTYNVRVGTSPGADDVVASRSLPDGTRLVPEAGNAGGNLFLELDASRLPKGPLFWSVQAVDASFLGGPFAVEQSASVDPSNGEALVGLQVAVSRTAGGLWQLTLKGTVAPAVAVVVEASDDLVDWVPFWWIRPDVDGTFTAAKYYTEEGWAPARFYRAHSASTSAEP